VPDDEEDGEDQNNYVASTVLADHATDSSSS